ncbi:MAG: hypothetical protein E7184_03020 [Erysipelotrichaceae bacterium]|nr:hypothetical protein [Erysipelotrichaceae bacterium]
MKYPKKVLKVLSIEELEKVITSLDEEEEVLSEKREEKLFKHVMESEIVNKRFWSDIVMVGTGAIWFQISEILPFIIGGPNWFKATVSGLSAIASIAIPIVLHRVGCKKLINKYYDEYKQYYLDHPEEYEKKVEEYDTRFDEDVRLDEISKEKVWAGNYLKLKREADKTEVRIFESASRMKEEIEEEPSRGR